MVKDMTDLAQIKMHLKLLDGTEHLGCDITSQPFGENERMVSCWVDGCIRIYPMEVVNCITLYEETK